MVDLSAQFAQFHEGANYDTGYRHQYFDYDIPDRQPHEPHGIRVHARESSRNRWRITATHGPYDERDESGSYYKSSPDVEDEHLEAPASKVKQRLRTTGNAELRRLMQRRT